MVPLSRLKVSLANSLNKILSLSIKTLYFLRLCKSAMNFWDESELSSPVGSSAKIRDGSLATARNRVTLCSSYRSFQQKSY